MHIAIAPMHFSNAPSRRFGYRTYPDTFTAAATNVIAIKSESLSTSSNCIKLCNHEIGLPTISARSCHSVMRVSWFAKAFHPHNIRLTHPCIIHNICCHMQLGLKVELDCDSHRFATTENVTDLISYNENWRAPYIHIHMVYSFYVWWILESPSLNSFFPTQSSGK